MSVIGQDVPMERPDTDGRAALFVPGGSLKEDILLTIRKGAAIAGFANHDGTLTLYYESNRFDDPMLAKWEHKARKAYDRLIDNAPTVSKMTAAPQGFEQIGYINGKGITIRRMESLKRWLSYSDALATCPETEIVPRSVVAKVDNGTKA
ncbi:hypothetical protein ACFDR9_001791 [Janthinobacterium sp. CG_23.3]|uniref:hypothetical protein n=1 Tax=unclassified Janthinobacterium TaxID=2610881 RepID=UPI0006881770|nr:MULTISPECIES: hypothetical protein [unclassified Janthinobacterium]MEC5162691.1 hypothetical protein [Janthinobacterium sp. CG_S6]